MWEPLGISTNRGTCSTQNFQQLITDCAASSTLKNQVKSALQSSVPNFLDAYFTVPATMISSFSAITGLDIWGNAFATALDRGYTIEMDIDDPSKWDLPVTGIRVKPDIKVERLPNGDTKWSFSIEFSW